MEDYKKKYEKALERAKEELGSGCFNKGSIEYIFPELKESEDERIRKELIDAIHGLWDNDALPMPLSVKRKDEWISWLEKQVSPDMVEDAYLRGCNDTEKKWLESKRYTKMDVDNAWLEGVASAKKELEKQGKIEIEKPITIGKCKLTGKAAELAKEVTPESLEETKKKMLEETKPKFKAGDWLINRTNASIIQIVEANNNGYYHYIDQNGQQKTSYLGYIEWDFRPWSITDAKDDDVLAGKIDGDDYILIFKQIKDGWVETYGHYHDAVDRFCAPSQLFCRDYKGTLHPATKEQRDLLFKKMHEAGYKWDFEKKEMKLLISNGGDFEPELSQKLTNWTEEDEKNLQGVIDEIQANKSNAPKYDLKTYDRFLSWLKSLKDRVQPQPQPKWSEEDEENLRLVLECFTVGQLGVAYCKVFDWLESIKQRLS